MADALTKAETLAKSGKLAEAASAFAAALASGRGNAAAWLTYGNVLNHLGRLGEAESAYKNTLAQAPDHAGALCTLGGVLRRLGRADEASALYAKAIETAPNDAEAWFGLALLHQDAGDFALAEIKYRRCLELAPHHGDGWANLGAALAAQNRPDEAEACYLSAAKLAPDNVKIPYNLGNLLSDQGRFDEAEAAFRHALTLNPTYALAHNNLGNLLKNSHRLDEAAECYGRAIAAAPDFAMAHSNLGHAMKDLGRRSEAERHFRRAIALDPKLAASRTNLGMFLLQDGRMAEGWAEYEHRFDCPAWPSPARPFPQTHWDGRKLPAGGKLLVWAEQGVGDEILHGSMVADLAQRNFPVIFECERRLVPLFARSFPSIEVVARRDMPHPRLLENDIAAQVPAAGLGRVLRPALGAFPPRPAFLRADPGWVEALRPRYGEGRSGPVIGISWRSKNVQFGPDKTTQLMAWAPIFAAGHALGATFVSLQYGEVAEDLAAVERSLGQPIVHDAQVDSLADLDLFAAQVKAMDLVISTSNTTVHMAGALGVPVWVMLPSGPGQLWYWMEGRDTNPFYPTLRLFRQTRIGIWDDVIARIAAALPHARERPTPGRAGFP